MGVTQVTHSGRAVFLDRDGVLNTAVVVNRRPCAPAFIDQLQIPEDVPEALDLLKEAGLLLIGITNQPDVARALQTRDAVEQINAKLLSILPVSEILVCYHDDQDHCECRKPKPGLLHEAASKYSIRLMESFMVGDRWKDVEAGRKAGCKTIWLDCGYREPAPDPPPDLTVSSLMQAVPWILAQVRGGAQ
jgi:D-glycero-D-manno-heptose 1,7-bisphosphate phosphatase